MRALRIRNVRRGCFESRAAGHPGPVSERSQPVPDADLAPAFAHAVEREIARVFDELGIAWLYEPHTFVLERSSDGAVREAFTPDFFLPELDLYVECTVMRPAYTRRKRRKASKARKRGGVDVEILFRRDIERLAARWQLPALARAARDGVVLDDVGV